MTHPPRCTRCGRVPPIRRIGHGWGRITWECSECGEPNEVQVEKLAPERRMDRNGSAA